MPSSTAPDSFASFGPPPVPAFAGIHIFVTSGSHLIRMFSTRSGGGASVGGRKRRADSHIGGGDVLRKTADRVCFAFRDNGSCKWGADCRFRHVRRRDGSGDGPGGNGGGGGRASGGGGSSTPAAAGGGLLRGSRRSRGEKLRARAPPCGGANSGVVWCWDSDS